MHAHSYVHIHKHTHTHKLSLWMLSLKMQMFTQITYVRRHTYTYTIQVHTKHHTHSVAAAVAAWHRVFSHTAWHLRVASHTPSCNGPLLGPRASGGGGCTPGTMSLAGKRPRGPSLLRTTRAPAAEASAPAPAAEAPAPAAEARPALRGRGRPAQACLRCSPKPCCHRNARGRTRRCGAPRPAFASGGRPSGRF